MSSQQYLTTVLYFDKVRVMITDNSKLWNDTQTRQLAEVLVAIDDQSTMQALLGDVMTPKEIIEISSRLEAARLLLGGATYTEIVRRTRLSSRTVARISDWLQNGYGGYKTVVSDMSTHQHTPPAPAD